MQDRLGSLGLKNVNSKTSGTFLTSVTARMGRLALIGAVFLGFQTSAQALELDWSGQFRTEFHFLKNYTLDGGANGGQLDPTRLQPVTVPSTDPSTPAATTTPSIPRGYYIPGGGSNNSTFETLFLRLRPKAIVNDNITIKSEFWLGNPSYSVFGDAYPYTFGERQFYSSQSRGSVISAQRLWAELLTDFGTVQLGRAPLHWGLGLVWNAGEGMWDRFESTGDQIRLISKFGSFTVSPGVSIYSTGNTLGGACSFSPATGTCIPNANVGFGSIADYNLMLKYENMDEDFEGGVNFIRRMANGQSQASGPLGTQSPTVIGGMAFNVWDLYAKKKWGKVTLAGEAPIISGNLDGIPYSTYALAGEANWKMSDTWETTIKAGHAPGNPNSQSTTPDRYRAFFFNPNYKIANVMFNYQLANLGGRGVNTLNSPNAGVGALLSPFDNPIVNANYVSWAGVLHADKWSFNTGLTYAYALEKATAGQFYYNTWNRRYEQANSNQGSSLGWEWDLGTGFQWDEYFLFRVDLGLYVPGNFFKFSNAPTENGTSTLFNTAFRVGVNF